MSADKLTDYLYDVLNRSNVKAFKSNNGFSRCLLRLLAENSWNGNPRNIVEALPYDTNALDVVDVRNILGRLNYKTSPHKINIGEIDPRLMPCLFLSDKGIPYIVLESNASGVRVYDGAKDKDINLERDFPSGTVFFKMDSTNKEEHLLGDHWYSRVGDRFRRVIIQMLAITLVVNLMSVFLPVFILVVYDVVIGQQSKDLIQLLSLGIAVVITVDLILRAVNAKLMAYFGARVEYILSTSALRQMLYMPYSSLQSAQIGKQLSRLTELESIRDFFSGPLSSTIIELPFLLIFMVAIYFIAGPLVIVPILLALAFTLAAVLLLPNFKERMKISSNSRAKRDGFLLETLTHLRPIKQFGLREAWYQRYRRIAGEASHTNLNSAQFSHMLQVIAHTLLMGAGVVTLAFGTYRVMNDQMSGGALIATMALMWRLISPMQTGFLALTRLEQVKLGLAQVNKLLELQLEREPDKFVATGRNILGRITFLRVSMRYRRDLEPALLAATFDINPGELAIITGANGSGKSSIIRLIAGLNRPQAGAIMLDGIDIRQLDPIEIRHSIGYVPQQREFFAGTIAENLRLAMPTATEEDLLFASDELGLLDEINRLPDGFDTYLDSNITAKLPSGFMQRLSLARAYIKNAPIMLLDEPFQGLDEEGAAIIMDSLEFFKGERTVLMVTHNHEHMVAADKIIVLDRGTVQHFGSPEIILPKLKVAA